MEKLSIEEKAKRYDEVVEKFDVILNLDIVKENGTIFADEYVEYIRTDVFVKKVEDFLYDELNHGDMECSNIEALIERFKKQIKGE